MSTIAKAAKTVKADYEILVELQNGNPVPKIPAKMKLGKTVHYTSNNGKVTITFPALHSPFLNRNGNEKLKITSTERPIELTKKGTFSFSCLITPPPGMVKKPAGLKNSSYLGGNIPYPGGNMDVG
jgi:hypothetical protein